LNQGRRRLAVFGRPSGGSPSDIFTVPAAAKPIGRRQKWPAYNQPLSAVHFIDKFRNL
jgi:hypothetical protein